MRKSLVFISLGIVAAGVCTLAILPSVSRRSTEPTANDVVAWLENGEIGRLTIRYPLDGAVFPSEIAAPTFRWEDCQSETEAWLLVLEFQDGENPMRSVTRAMEWTPSDEEWEAIKRRSLGEPAEVAILGFNQDSPQQILSGARITITTSRDEVGAPPENLT